MNSSNAHLVEIFSSIQGEGIFAGARQIFLRFQGCTLQCAYCDTQATQKETAPEYCRIESHPGSGKFFASKNPITIDIVKETLATWVNNLPGAHHSISLTGGEPLIHAELLSTWLPVLQGVLPLYLETNGIMIDGMKQCIDHIEYISMDFKLPSTTGMPSMWETHHAFLKIASAKTVFVKAVISNNSTADEIITCAEIMRSINRNIPLILQPQTDPSGNCTITATNLLLLQETASKLLTNVRVIPQMHKFINVL